MKYTIIATVLAGIVSVNAASITFDNLRLGGNDIVLLDNAGVALTSFTGFIYSGTSPLDAAAASELVNPISRIDFSLAAGNVLGPGLYASSFDVDNTAGTFTGLDLFVVFTDGNGFAAIDIVSTYGNETPTAPFSVDEPLNNPSLITLQDSRSGPGTFSFDALNAGEQPAYGLRLAVIPEPSSVLLGGLALCGGILRRRR